jgi:flavin-dependent dehydrogenase
MNYTDIYTHEHSYTIPMPPPTVGYWLFPGSHGTANIQFHMPKKPNWLHRTMMRLLLGFEWRDKK